MRGLEHARVGDWIVIETRTPGRWGGRATAYGPYVVDEIVAPNRFRGVLRINGRRFEVAVLPGDFQGETKIHAVALDHDERVVASSLRVEAVRVLRPIERIEQ